MLADGSSSSVTLGEILEEGRRDVKTSADSTDDTMAHTWPLDLLAVALSPHGARLAFHSRSQNMLWQTWRLGSLLLYTDWC